MATLLVKNIGCLQTPVGSYSHKGKQQAENLKLQDAAILIEDGVIKEITSEGNLPTDAEEADAVIDAEGNLVTPGLVEGHTHMVFGGYRQNEIPLKLKGAGYLDILRAGGGILDTVRKTRAASFEELYQKTEGFLDEMMGFGVTTCEAKSGYGLDFDTEVKMLEVLKKLNEDHPMDIVSTFMGAHAIPEEYKDRADAFIDMLCEKLLPYVKEHDLAEFADVFTEDSVFNYEQSRKYLECAKGHGFDLKIHADEIEAIGGSVLAGEMGAVSCEHLIAINEEGLASMAEAGTTAMCLPATSFYLGADFAPARKMIELGIPVAMASDFNPGSCPSLNLQFVMNLGCLKYKMLPEEILTAVTINPACAINRGDKVGTLEPGKKGDLVIWDAPNMEMLCYRFGSNLALQVIKEGNLV
ncbi:imidazolonepropionase [Emergencia sp.]|uniref:imidazolonepropionase n=1 Tax=Emergencia sp. TaxID=1926557 RepID=UPI003AF18BC5